MKYEFTLNSVRVLIYILIWIPLWLPNEMLFEYSCDSRSSTIGEFAMWYFFTCIIICTIYVSNVFGKYITDKIFKK